MRASAQGISPGRTISAVDGPGDYPTVVVTRPYLRGNAIKTILLLSLSIAGYAGIAVALSGAGQPLSETETRISPSIAAPPPSLKTPVGAIARGAPSSGPQNPNKDKSTAMPVPGSTHDDNNVTAKLSEYVFLHKTRNERIPLQVVARANVCPE